MADSGTSDVSWITTLTNADATRTGAQATAQASWVTNQVQAGASSLLWSGGDSTSTNASGTWVTQYAPVRTAKIMATSLIDAARQVASWFDSKEEANKQANADVKFVEDVKDPNTQVATSLTQHEGTASASVNTSGNDLSEDIDSSQRRIRNAVVSIESTRAIDEAKAQKKRDVALAGLAEGASTTAVDKTYQDDMAKALFAWQQSYANLTYDEGSEQLKAVTETITEFGQAGKKYVEDAAGAEKTYTDALAPIIGTRTVSYIQAGIALLKASTGADNIWRNNTAQAWATHTGGDLTARGNTQRGVANASSLLADASRASIAEHKAQWWQTEIPNYLQWSTDVGAIETTYTDDTTDNILQRAIGVKNAGVKYATDVGIAIKDYDVNTAAAREEYISSLMTIAKSIGDKLLDAQRDKEIALANAELQKQLTGNESAYSSAVQAANDAYTNTTNSEEASRKSQEQTALSTMNTKLSNELKNKDADIAAAEREYDQTVASLDAQYGSASSNGDTGVEGATRRSAIKTRDAQYYAARDTSWANTLSGTTTLGTSPWTVKAITAANGQAAFSTARASAQAAHDEAILDAIEDWQLSSSESLTDLLFTEGQSRETYNVATSNVYANWGNGVGNLLGDKPEGTGWEKPEKPIVTDSKSVPTLDKSVGYMTFDETTDEETSTKNTEDSPSRPGNPETWKYKERSWIDAITEETAGYFYNYGYYLGVEVYTAGTTITETGAAIGDAVGEHSARMYFDPWEEFNILAESATELAIALKSLEQRFIADPVGTLQMVGNASIDYLDDLTSNPETSGKLLGNIAILWATTGATGGTSTYLRSLFGSTKAVQAASAAGTTGAATSTTSQAANVAKKVAGDAVEVLDKVEDVVDNIPSPKNVSAPDGALKELVEETPKPVSKPKPYSNPKNRPKYADGQVDEVWENAKQADGKVYDPNTGEELIWDRTKPRTRQWNMGHRPGKKYSDLYKDYMEGKLTLEEFLREYRDPKNYWPEHWLENQSHKWE